MEVENGPWNEVFDNLLLREMILRNVIENGKNVSRADIRSIRMVNREWVVTIEELLQKRKEPLFHLVLKKENSLNVSSSVKRKGKLLENFVKTVTGDPNSRIHKATPTFSLAIEEDFFREENYESLSKCFEKCGGGIMEMKMKFPRKSATFPGILHPPSLPILKKLTVTFPKVYYATSNVFCNLLDRLLQKSTAITDFEITFCKEVHTDIQYIFLPSSLTSIKLACALSTHQLDFIRKNKLANLSHLELLVPQHSLQTEALFKALESVRTTLKSLSIVGMEYTGHHGEVTYLRFPRMENLEKLEIESMNCKLEEKASRLELVLPKLTELTLTNQTLPMFQKWTRSFTSSTVTKVDVHVVAVSPFFQTLTLDRNEMSALHRSFPNLTSLLISVFPVVTGGLLYIFQEMETLTDLTLAVVPGSGLGADFWESLLLGAEPDTVRMLRSNPNTWKEIRLIQGTRPSIRNLRNLCSLSLWEMASTESSVSENPDPLISDVAFYFSFMEMPKLKTLTLGSRFKPDELTAESWRESDPDRTIVICE